MIGHHFKIILKKFILIRNDLTETTLISDLTGNNNFAYAISGKTPLFKTNMINGKPYLYFDSTQSDLLLSGYMPPSGANNRTIIAVYADAATTADGSNSRLMFAYGKDYGNAFGLISVYSTNLKMYTQSNTLVGGTTATPTTATIAEVGVNGTSVYLYLNGTLDTSGTQTVNTLGYNSLWIGSGWWSGAGRFTGGIAEIMAFDKALSASERNDVTTYLKSKYNIP